MPEKVGPDNLPLINEFEADTALLLERLQNIELVRYYADMEGGRFRTKYGDWIDPQTGLTYDGITIPIGRFSAERFSDTVFDHIQKRGLDNVVIDLSLLSQGEVNTAKEIAEETLQHWRAIRPNDETPNIIWILPEHRQIGGE